MKQKEIAKSKVFLSSALLISVLGTILFNAAKATWVFVDITLKIDSFTLYLLYAGIGVSVLSAILSVLRFYEVKRNGSPLYKQKSFSVLSVLSFAAAVFILIVGIVFPYHYG